MAIRFVPKTDDELKPKTVSPAPAIADAPINEAPSPIKSARAKQPKPKDGPRDAAESKGE